MFVLVPSIMQMENISLQRTTAYDPVAHGNRGEAGVFKPVRTAESRDAPLEGQQDFDAGRGELRQFPGAAF